MKRVIGSLIIAAALGTGSATLAQEKQPAAGAMPVPPTDEPAVASQHESQIFFYDDGTLGVDVVDIPLSVILEHLADSGGFELVSRPEAEIDIVTLQFDSLPWKEAFDELLSVWRFALTTDPETGLPTKLVLLSFDTGEYDEAAVAAANMPALGHTVDVATASHRSSLEEAAAIAAQLVERQEDPLAADLRRALDAKAAIEQAAAERTELSPHDRDRLIENYAESLLALGLHPDPRTLDALAPAVADTDVRVRAAAVRALREGAANESGAPVLSDVRRLITSDPDPEVRREAFEVYSRWGEQGDVLSLAKSLGRSEGPVQDIAVREWIRIEQEREAILAGKDVQQSQQETFQSTF